MKKNLFFLAAATIALASCSNEEVIEMSRNSDVIDFRAAIQNGATSRGIETTQTNFSQFYVTAMYGNQQWFSNVLFSKQAGKNTYMSEEEQLWPGKGTLDFYAWGYNPGNGDNIDPANCGEVYIDNVAQQLTFTPIHEITNQIDLVTAFQTAGKGDVKEDGIGLTFNHALCEIQINALSNNTEYVFDVCGFAICNVKNKGVMEMNPANADKKGLWTLSDTDLDDYVMFFDPNKEGENRKAIRLNGSTTPISNSNALNSGYIMPIPQELVEWDQDIDPENSQSGAFIAMLVKITNKDNGVEVYPRRADDEGVRAGESNDVKGYGWACVPVNTVWEAGYRYIYNLDFSYGAGQFDPKDPVSPGEDILGGPITFNVVVTEWTPSASTQDVNMNGNEGNTEGKEDESQNTVNDTNETEPAS